ncbi:MAG: TPM domain-containing protein, partial [Duncaniella sp.]|nr:TPM domain-containing protein [Duncaniella sp.]
FATELFEKWGIGKGDNDNGVLFLVSRDDREAHIRTGYGVEGALPDIIASRILNDKVYPYFRQGDYDSGVIAGTEAITKVLSDPSVRDELMSSRPNDRLRTDDSDSLFDFFLTCAFILALAATVYVVTAFYTTRRMDDTERWNRLNRLWLPLAVISFITVGMGLIPFGLLVYKMHRIRRHKRRCPHCNTPMQLVDEVHDNDYLTPSQDLEEKLDSVDYDVWHCPKCAQTDIYPYVNRSSRYSECPRCHARALSQSERRILRQPTVRQEGEGVDLYYCRNCGNHTEKRFRIPRKQDDSALGAAAAGAVLGSMLGGRGGGFGGGGFSGGSFGGGHTGGGGAGGSW